MDGIKRLANMLQDQKDKYLNIIVNHLMLQTEMNEDFLKEEKNLKDMATYIKDNAKKEATSNVAVIEDETVFKWAKEYFIKSNDELGIKKFSYAKGKYGDLSKTEIKDNDEFGSIFDTNSNIQLASEKKEIEQISLFAA